MWDILQFSQENLRFRRSLDYSKIVQDMPNTIPDIIFLPIPLSIIYAYIKTEFPYINMTKFFTYLLSAIAFSLLMYGVFFCFHNASWVVRTFSDVCSCNTPECEIKAFEGINTLFSGLAFIAVLFTLIVQMQQLKGNMQEQEKNSILHSISTLQTTLSNLNTLFNATQASQERENKFTHFSDYLYHKISETFTILEEKYQKSTSDAEKHVIIKSFIKAFESQTQKFIEVSYLFMTIHERIENSVLLNSREKTALCEQAIFLFHHSDIKLLSLMLIELNSNGKDALPKNLRAHFTEQYAKSAITALGKLENAEFCDKIYTSIRNIKIDTKA